MIFPPLWSNEVEDRIRAEAHSIDQQKTPPHVQMCKRCVVTNQRPRITFDAEGICSACRYSDAVRQREEWDFRRQKLEEIFQRKRRQEGYDCIVPCSGGKDSSTVAYRLKHEFNVNPLCVKWAPFVYTEIGRQNMDALVQHGFDVIEMTPNGLLHRKLARLAFEYLGDHFQPFVYGQLAFPMQMAVKLGIDLVFGAENGEAQYGGDTSANDKHCWDYTDWERVYLKGAGVERLVQIGRDLGVFADPEVRQLSEFYRLPEPEKLKNVEYHWLAHYLPHHPQSNFYMASEKTGFRPNPERNVGTYSRYASIDDATDDWHYFMAYVKFGIGRCTSDAAHEIRDGDLTREEGLVLVAKYDGEFPPKHKFEMFKSYLGLTDEQFWRAVERFRGAQVQIERAA